MGKQQTRSSRRKDQQCQGQDSRNHAIREAKIRGIGQDWRAGASQEMTMGEKEDMCNTCNNKKFIYEKIKIKSGIKKRKNHEDSIRDL